MKITGILLRDGERAFKSPDLREIAWYATITTDEIPGAGVIQAKIRGRFVELYQYRQGVEVFFPGAEEPVFEIGDEIEIGVKP